jgi:hypothetical protein
MGGPENIASDLFLACFPRDFRHLGIYTRCKCWSGVSGHKIVTFDGGLSGGTLDPQKLGY